MTSPTLRVTIRANIGRERAQHWPLNFRRGADRWFTHASREKTKTTDEAELLSATPAPEFASDPVVMNGGESRLPGPAGLVAHGTNPVVPQRRCTSTRVAMARRFRLC